MSTHKTIKINPELFTLTKQKKTNPEESHAKTKKNTKFKPNNLKNKLLERIKAHKNREANLGGASKEDNSTKFDTYTNEFDDSMAYLASIAKQSKETANKNAYIQNTQNAIYGGKKTLKNYYATPTESFHVELDLPEELKETPMTHHTPTNESTITLTSSNSKYMADNQVPYGCLKGGNKPTFKVWNKTQKQLPVAPPVLSINTSSATTSPNITLRETKMKELKEKMRKKQLSLELAQPPAFQQSSLPKSNPISKQINNKPPEMPTISLPPESNNESLTETINTQEAPITSSPSIEETPHTQQIEPKKIKKTIKRTYTLGKSKIHKRVGVLIKDKTMRKRVLQAQRDIKRHNINDVKQYLRTHGLIKAGSSAPNDIVRKIYESAMLSGEVTNQDKDVLLQNFLKEKEES